MAHIDEGLQSWQLKTNHNRMIDLQRQKLGPSDGPVELAFFGRSAFRITSPAGVTVMLDPWRNLPTRRWDWYFHDFPQTAVDIGVSTHAHFDHDALHRLDAHVLLDRLIGSYEFADVKITGIADKHATDSSNATYDFKKIIKEFGGVDIEPEFGRRLLSPVNVVCALRDYRPIPKEAAHSDQTANNNDRNCKLVFIPNHQLESMSE